MEVPVGRLQLRDDPGVLSPPQVTQPYKCARAVKVTGYVPDASLDLEVNGTVVVSGFPGGSPEPDGALIPVSPLNADDVVRARQHRGAGASPWSGAVKAKDHTLEFPAGPPRPEMFGTPLYECGARTGVKNLLVGCDVTVTSDGSPVGAATGANEPQGINVNPNFGIDQHVRAVATLCGDPSAPSVEHVVEPAPLPLPPPGFDPYVVGAPALTLNTIVNGAHYTLSRNGIAQAEIAGWGGKSYVNLAPPVAATDAFSATQRLCLHHGPSEPGHSRPQPCSSLAAPKAAAVQAGDTVVVLTEFYPGAEIKVFVNGFKIGDGSGPVVGLITPIPHGGVLHILQRVGSCEGGTAWELRTRCVAPPVWGDPSALNLFPVGTHEYATGQVTIEGFTYDVRGKIYYPAEDDGVDKPFNSRLAALGRVPIVFCVHGSTVDVNIPSHLGYDYLQYHLSRMGYVAVAVDERQTNPKPDSDDGTGNVRRRGLLTISSIAALQQFDTSGPILQGKIDFGRTGLMGHSRGGDAMLVVAERLTLPGVIIRAILAVAPVYSDATTGRPQGYPYMVILPAADGDVVDSQGARLYDLAKPGPVKTQLYVDHANHNYFNRQWQSDDTKGKLPVMGRYEHERILLTYGCALFRFAFHNDPVMRSYLEGRLLPWGVVNHHVHLSYAAQEARTVDDFERPPITVNTEQQPTAQTGGLVAQRYFFARVPPGPQAPASFNESFFGETTGNVSLCREGDGRFREQLRVVTDLTRAEIRVRAAEVFEGSIPPNPTGFRVGVEDTANMVAWVDVDDVGGLPRPFDRQALEPTKTMLTTFRFPGSCFAAVAPQLRLTSIRAILLGLNRGDRRPIAFDDVQIVNL
jgi:hypothetical protein